MVNPKTSDENLFWEKGFFQSLPFFSLIFIVKAYFITCFCPKCICKVCKEFNKRQQVVLRDSKCWTQALKIKVSCINCFINKSINNRRDTWWLLFTIPIVNTDILYHFHLLILNFTFLYLLKTYLRFSYVFGVFRNVTLGISELKRLKIEAKWICK